MIRWFKRKKKKDRGQESEDLFETGTEDGGTEDGGAEEGGTEEEKRDGPEEASGAQTLEEPEPVTFAPAEGLGQDDSLSGEQLPGEEDVLEEEEDVLDEEEGAPEEGVPRRGFFRRLRQRLKGTREKFVHRIDRLVLGKRVIDDELLDQLEEILITSDLGVRTTGMLLRKVADKVKRKELSDPARLREQIREEIRSVLSVEAPVLDYRTHKPFVVMIVGVNGTGKTTTTGKLANQLKLQGLKPMLAACDTFRAAAAEPLSIWGDRTGVPVVRQKSGSDPSAVAFDALDAAVSRDIDVILMDTAGRMHTKVNLMEELKKIHRVINKKMPEAPHEVFLVLDASTGQNALSQAKLFKEGIGLTGLILTKLDGTARGGIIAAICDELQVPVRYIGIGERLDDLRPFDAEEFTNALF
jgi:fused signal recognition particle receptor